MGERERLSGPQDHSHCLTAGNLHGRHWVGREVSTEPPSPALLQAHVTQHSASASGRTELSEAFHCWVGDRHEKDTGLDMAVAPLRAEPCPHSCRGATPVNRRALQRLSHGAAA